MKNIYFIYCSYKINMTVCAESVCRDGEKVDVWAELINDSRQVCDGY